MDNYRTGKPQRRYPRMRKQTRRVFRGGKRATVIAVVGAGGKSTYISERAKAYTEEGKKVAVTTTTHIYDPRVCRGILSPGQKFLRQQESKQQEETQGKQQGKEQQEETQPVMSLYEGDYFGVPTEGCKLGPLSSASYHKICAKYDVVLVEADGSHGMPAKIPHAGEPVIPDNVDEIVVVMGKQAIGRPAAAVVQHLGQTQQTWLLEHTCLGEDQLRSLARHYYLKPLAARYPRARVHLYFSDPFRCGRNLDVTDITFVLMASGFGRRFESGTNKLLADFRGRRLYQHSLEHIIRAADLLQQHSVCVRIAVVTQYPEIMKWVNDRAFSLAGGHSRLKVFENPRAGEGIMASVRTGLRAAAADGSQAVVFFAADMPYLGAEECMRFVWEFLCSGKTYGCMAVRDSEKRSVTTTVPGAFRIESRAVANQILALHGDKGPMRVIAQHPWDTYLFYVESHSVKDIDHRV